MFISFKGLFRKSFDAFCQISYSLARSYLQCKWLIAYTNIVVKIYNHLYDLIRCQLKTSVKNTYKTKFNACQNIQVFFWHMPFASLDKSSNIWLFLETSPLFWFQLCIEDGLHIKNCRFSGLVHFKVRFSTSWNQQYSVYSVEGTFIPKFCRAHVPV